MTKTRRQAAGDTANAPEKKESNEAEKKNRKAPEPEPEKKNQKKEKKAPENEKEKEKNAAEEKGRKRKASEERKKRKRESKESEKNKRKKMSESEERHNQAETSTAPPSASTSSAPATKKSGEETAAARKQTEERDGDGERDDDVGEEDEDGGGGGEEIMAMRPRMHFKPDQYNKSIKVPTRCFVEEVLETFANVGLTERESDWFENHPQFCHILHMPRSSHMVQSMWMLLLRTADIERKKEAWFVVNGVPIRYGIREHCLISGLDCKHYPEDWKVKGSLAFKRKHFRDGKVLRTEVKEKFETMGADDTGDRLKMAVLYFLSSIIYSPDKTGKQGTGVEDLFFRYVVDLDLCQTFPWGRYSFERILESIANTMAHYGGTVTAPFVFPGFCIPLEVRGFNLELLNSFVFV